MENDKDRERRLDALFEQLQLCGFQNEMRAIQADIWQLWLSHSNKAVFELMDKGVTHLSNESYTNAIDSFTEVISLDPSFAEGWNKRATAYYLRGNFKDSIVDIDQTLSLEKRHFGALSGLATIYMELRAPRRALSVLRQVKKILPHDRQLAQQICDLEKLIDTSEQ